MLLIDETLGVLGVVIVIIVEPLIYFPMKHLFI